MKKTEKVKKTDIEQYIEDCKTNYLSPFNDGYTREYYKGELLRLKEALDKAILEVVYGRKRISS